MASNTFHLTIASVGQSKFEREARQLTVPGIAGEMTILPHHEALVTTLKPGKARVIDSDGKEEAFDITGGILEISHNRAIVLL